MQACTKSKPSSPASFSLAFAPLARPLSPSKARGCSRMQWRQWVACMPATSPAPSAAKSRVKSGAISRQPPLFPCRFSCLPAAHSFSAAVSPERSSDVPARSLYQKQSGKARRLSLGLQDAARNLSWSLFSFRPIFPILLASRSSRACEQRIFTHCAQRTLSRCAQRTLSRSIGLRFIPPAAPRPRRVRQRLQIFSSPGLFPLAWVSPALSLAMAQEGNGGLRAKTAALPLPKGWTTLRHKSRTLYIK